jgi:hypothetical protein
VRGLERGELLAEDGDDLLAEDVQLLQDGRERQTGVVDEEQLALVVTDVLAEAERSLDDLLRAADGQRGLAAELLQRGTVAVHRRVVEVRPELPHGILTVLAHEDLPAETDDGLIRGAVAVVLVALAVELHHLLAVRRRPEDVVVEEPVAVVRRVLRDLRAADAAVPDEGRYSVERARGGREGLQRGAVLTLPVDDVLVPQPAKQRVVLDREVDAVADVLAEPRIDGTGIAAAHHQVNPATRQVLQHRVVLGDLHRIIRGDQRRRRRQLQPAGLRRDVCQRRRRRRGEEGRIVVLAEREDVQTHLLRLLRDGDHCLDPLRLSGRAAVRGVSSDVADREDAELHRDLQ